VSASSTTAPASAPARGGRNVALIAGLALLGGLAVFVYLYRIGMPSWLSDELYYRDAGRAYVHGDFSVNRENTLLAKYILGVVQLVFGSGTTAVRAPAALAGLLTGVGLLLLGRRIAGLGAGVTAFALWCFLPRAELIGAYQVGRVKIERYFRLEVFMGMFSVLALLLAWRWAENGRWRYALAAGVGVGLAAASKAPGILVLPAVLVVGVYGLRPTRRVAAQAAGATGAAFLTVALTYVPLGTDAFDAIHGMFYVDKLRNNGFSTPFVFFGHLYQRPPWWADLWWQWKSLGTPAAAAVGICLVLAPFLLSRRSAVMLFTALVVPLLFFLVRLRYALPYYYYAWQPQLMLVCALVLVALARRGRPAQLAAAALAVPLVVAGLGTVRDVGRVRARDYAAVADRLGPRLRSGAVVTWGLEASNVMRAEAPYLPVTLTPVGQPNVSAVIVDPAIASRRPSPPITDYLRAHRDRLVMRRVDRLRVYLPRGSAAAAIAAGGPGSGRGG
jgi:4-amino-4-deoxy-L-arabinose transferase-like glycosyltransferase